VISNPKEGETCNLKPAEGTTREKKITAWGGCANCRGEWDNWGKIQGSNIPGLFANGTPRGNMRGKLKMKGSEKLYFLWAL